VITGAVLDVALDIRKDSPTYGQFVAEELTASNKRMLYIPPGFAHGFATLEDNTIFTYKCTDYYHPESEGGILWNSPSLNIPWRLENPVLSAKDEQLTDFAHFNSPF
jgi:dTDP-4-dehydrorhamnose 3,5-epimerase